MHRIVFFWICNTYSCLNVPHFIPMQISFVDDLDSMNPSFDVIGPLVESCTTYYPERVNAEFVQVATTMLFMCIYWLKTYISCSSEHFRTVCAHML